VLVERVSGVIGDGEQLVLEERKGLLSYSIHHISRATVKMTSIKYAIIGIFHATF
jgi:hypothetical protein